MRKVRTVDCTKLEPPGKRREEKKNDESVTAQNGVQQTRVGWVEEAGTERDGEGTAGCASFRPTSLARAARPRAARGRRQAAVSTSKNRAARPRPNFAGAAERGAGAARDGEGTAGCARFRLASLPHAARPHALPVGRARVE